MFNPGLPEFLRRARTDTVIPVWGSLLVDWETPASLYRRLAGGGPSYLLESVEEGVRLGRYSFIGLQPQTLLTARGGRLEVQQGGRTTQMVGEPLGLVGRYLQQYRVSPWPELSPFYGGAVGYFGYDLIRQREPIPELTRDDTRLPDLCLVICRLVLIYDHLRRVLTAVALAPAAGGRQAYAEAERDVGRLLEEVERGRRENGPPLALSAGEPEGRLSTNMGREQFIRAVRRAKEYIAAGDAFQVVLSRRWQAPAPADPFQLYRALRTLNPSPYMFYLDLPGVALAGASPEMLVKVEDRRVEYRPIAGTRPRGVDAAADAELARDLLHDPKERAEHLMLVDLGRNDLGRVCEYGSVTAERLWAVERYSHVLHLVSYLTGRLREDVQGVEALAACFPAGTVTGAPKVRAMQLIEELEPTRRGPYAGAVGYLGFSGNLDTCITIRTLCLAGGQAYLQAGAGIVADSDPEREYEETWNKARAGLRALAAAAGGEASAAGH